MTKPAITHMDGFDAYPVGVLPVDLAGRWTAAAPIVTGFVTAAGRGGGGGHYLHSTGPLFLAASVGPAAPGALVGVALRPYDVGNADGLTTRLLRVQDASGATAIGVTIDDTRRLRVVRTGTTVLAGPTVALGARAWVYLEWLVVCSATVGSFELRLDGATVLSGSGLDTSGGVACDRFALGTTTGLLADLDDLYLCDLTGTAGRDFHGDLTVRRIPVIAAGDRQEWTPVGGATNVENVAPYPPDPDPGTVQATAVGTTDLYVLDGGYLGGPPAAVGPVATARKTDSGPRAYQLVARAGGSSVDVLLGSPVTLTPDTRLLAHQAVLATDPTRAGAAWTVDTARDTQFGITVTS